MRVWGGVLITLVALLGGCADLRGGELGPQATWPTVRRGDAGRTVVTVQYLLRHHGGNLSVDGSFGSATESAVRSFQSARNLTVDGVVGPSTWGALITVVRRGDNNNAVRAVQDQLANRYGYALAVDGVFGPATEAAVKSFQASWGLAQDGVVGPSTWNALVTNVGGGTDRAGLAQRILASGNITLWPYSPVSSSSSDGADARSNIRDTASGGPARRSSYGTAPGGSVYLDPRMLSGMLRAAETYRFRVTSIAGGSHSATSRHYAGLAYDTDVINGVSVGARGRDAVVAGFMRLCRELGADEVLGPGDAGHWGHVHCAWPR
ncbi:peptidoglycan-binding domain-containing protein [Truepera radiovictrix]|uniref:peptidoglycan-binding domain-containing protein n=1 Tax=Truepera radiovictrix TaxID=332249 RepID=UPI000310203A|nr:peptidoglycan-binding protein [Truepera radiovictrix]WMT58763.1 peptidoglycan-binding protein [Truepera radiovictrix]